MRASSSHGCGAHILSKKSHLIPSTCFKMLKTHWTLYSWFQIEKWASFQISDSEITQDVQGVFFMKPPKNPKKNMLPLKNNGFQFSKEAPIFRCKQTVGFSWRLPREPPVGTQGTPYSVSTSPAKAAPAMESSPGRSKAPTFSVEGAFDRCNYTPED